MIAIIDYGVGNLFSLKSSFDAIHAPTVVTGDPDTIRRATGVILPGVGAFADAAQHLHTSGLGQVVVDVAAQGKPVMGICLGMQLLFEKSFEYGMYAGLGLLKGEVRPIGERIPQELKIPHMGWNALQLVRSENPLLRYTQPGEYVYFVHSYAAEGCEDSLIATAEYGVPLTAAVARGNVYGCQFHPEKSGPVGLRILQAFCEIGGAACENPSGH